MKVIITFTFRCNNLWKSKFVALEKPGKLGIFFSYFVATLTDFLCDHWQLFYASVELRCCWLGDRKGIWPVMCTASAVPKILLLGTGLPGVTQEKWAVKQKSRVQVATCLEVLENLVVPLIDVSGYSWCNGCCYYLHHRLASGKGIVSLVIICHAVCLSAALVSSSKVMRCIQCSLVSPGLCQCTMLASGEDIVSLGVHLSRCVCPPH